MAFSDGFVDQVASLVAHHFGPSDVLDASRTGPDGERSVVALGGGQAEGTVAPTFLDFLFRLVVVG
jgi:hypothetical protein